MYLWWEEYFIIFWKQPFRMSKLSSIRNVSADFSVWKAVRTNDILLVFGSLVFQNLSVDFWDYIFDQDENGSFGTFKRELNISIRKPMWSSKSIHHFLHRSVSYLKAFFVFYWIKRKLEVLEKIKSSIETFMIIIHWNCLQNIVLISKLRF